MPRSVKWLDFDALAGEYVLDTLDSDARTRFEAEIGRDPQAARAVAAWEERLAPLVASDEPVEPPGHLLDAVKRRIALAPSTRSFVTIRAGVGEWTPLAPGIAVKTLFEDRIAGMRSILMRLEPGTTYDGHEHPADEECLMIEGEMTLGDITLKAGDYHLAPKGLPHGRVSSAKGAVVFIRSAIPQ
ncbi:MAG: cupin domain-containing protein [Alphaproteobacteria bacterium]